MSRVLVSVLYIETREMRDFEIPSRMRAADFGQKVSEVFESGTSPDSDRYWYQVEAVSLNKILRSDETLEQAGIWDGEILLVSRQKRAESSSPSTVYVGPSAVSGAPKDPQKIPDKKTAGTPRTFIWKKLDQ